MSLKGAGLESPILRKAVTSNSYMHDLLQINNPMVLITLKFLHFLELTRKIRCKISPLINRSISMPSLDQ